MQRPPDAAPRPAPPPRRRAAESPRAARTKSPRSAPTPLPRACRRAGSSPPSRSSPARSGSRREALPRGCGLSWAIRSRPQAYAAKGCLQHRAHVLGLVANLLVREAEVDQPRGGMRLIAEPVARLLSGGPVIPQPVRLHHQPEVRPVEIDLEAVDPLFRLGQRQTGPICERQEQPLQLRASQPERSAVEQGAERPDPRLTAVWLQLKTQGWRVDQIESVGLVHSPLDEVGA